MVSWLPAGFFLGRARQSFESYMMSLSHGQVMICVLSLALYSAYENEVQIHIPKDINAIKYAYADYVAFCEGQVPSPCLSVRANAVKTVSPVLCHSLPGF